MLDLLHFGPMGKQVVQVPLPPGRILALSVFAGRRPIQDRFDSAPYTGRRLRLGFPHRRQHFEHEASVDSLNR